MGSESKGGVDVLPVDEAYEFSAPRFFDFMNDESEDEIRSAELWFEISQSYASSPLMPKISEGRPVQIDSLCDFGNAEQIHKKEPEQDNNQKDDTTTVAETIRLSAGQRKEMNNGKMFFEFAAEVLKPCDTTKEEKSASVGLVPPGAFSSKEASLFAFPILPSSNMVAAPALNLSSTAIKSRTPKQLGEAAVKGSGATSSKNQRVSEACTHPKLRGFHPKATAPNSSKNQTAKKIANLIRQPSAVKLKDQTPCAQPSKCTRPPKSVIKCPGSTNAKNNAMASEITQENQAMKRQKLDGGRSRQILNVKTRVLPHNSKPDLASGTDIFASSLRGFREDSLACKEQAPFISTAEMVSKFQ